jgi:hypothetical protein
MNAHTRPHCDIPRIPPNKRPLGFDTLAACIAAVRDEIAARRRAVSESRFPLRGGVQRMHLFNKAPIR